MAVKIISKDERPLLSRIEVHAQIDFTGKPTPSKADLKKEMSALEKADESLVIIKTVYTKFGESFADILAYIYTDKDAMVKLDLDAKKQAAADAKVAAEAAKKAAEEKPVEGAKPAAEAKPEVKTEEKPEEKKEVKPAEADVKPSK